LLILGIIQIGDTMKRSNLSQRSASGKKCEYERLLRPPGIISGSRFVSCTSIAVSHLFQKIIVFRCRGNHNKQCSEQQTSDFIVPGRINWAITGISAETIGFLTRKLSPNCRLITTLLLIQVGRKFA
jgi:hypothetical protein